MMAIHACMRDGHLRRSSVTAFFVKLVNSDSCPTCMSSYLANLCNYEKVQDEANNMLKYELA